MKNEHDDRYTHADRADIYEKLEKNPISTLASPDQCARVPLKGMTSPTGKAYHGNDKKLEDIIKISMINENDFKIDIMEDFIHSSEYTNILTNFYHNHFHIITQSKLFYMHYFPLDTYITANGLRKLEFGQKCEILNQQLYILGDFNDKNYNCSKRRLCIYN